MKLIRHELRKLIEGIFIGDDDGTVLSPKDVDDFEYSGQVKDDKETLNLSSTIGSNIFDTDFKTSL